MRPSSVLSTVHKLEMLMSQKINSLTKTTESKTDALMLVHFELQLEITS
jgi:hypothetical protein